MVSEHEDYNARYELARRFFKAFGELQGYLAAAAMPKKQAPMTHNQLRILYLILHEPGISQTTLAERLNVTTAAISMAVRDLETQNFVYRQTNADDTRSMLLFLAPQGQQIFEKIFDSYVSILINLFAALPLSDEQKMVETLEQVLTARRVHLNHNQSPCE